MITTQFPFSFSSSYLSTPTGGNAQVVLGTAGGPSACNVIQGLVCSSATNLAIQDGSTTVFSVDVPSTTPQYIMFPVPLKGSPGQAMTITATATGGNAKLNVLGVTQQPGK